MMRALPPGWPSTKSVMSYTPSLYVTQMPSALILCFATCGAQAGWAVGHAVYETLLGAVKLGVSGSHIVAFCRSSVPNRPGHSAGTHLMPLNVLHYRCSTAAKTFHSRIVLTNAVGV